MHVVEEPEPVYTHTEEKLSDTQGKSSHACTHEAHACALALEHLQGFLHKAAVGSPC